MKKFGKAALVSIASIIAFCDIDFALEVACEVFRDAKSAVPA
jgi:hypothetical protein